jgi:hypothetical protein
MRWISLLIFAVWPMLVVADEQAPNIAVSATGAASAAPDMATVSLGVSRDARTASQAMDAVALAAEAVLADIETAGIAARDVQTSSLNLNPVWDHSNSRPPQIRGYNASTMLTVRVRELDGLGGLLDSVVGEGANTLNGLTFGFADRAPLETAARTDAVVQARAMAETLAEAAGVTLGPVLNISEGGEVGPAPMMRGTMMEAAAVPVAAGELDVRVTVTVVFGIAD